MFNILFEMEDALPRLLTEDGWHSVYVDYHPPFVERVWKQVGENRIYLHRIHPCTKNEALFHRHPWPSAMRIVEGEYEMALSYGKESTPPPYGGTFILPAGSAYEMVEPDGWHYVRPLHRPTLSLMVTGRPWENQQSPKSTKPLGELSLEKTVEIIDLFKKKYPGK